MLITPRLRIREFTTDDAGLLFDLDSDPEVLRYVGPSLCHTVDDYRERIATLYCGYYARSKHLGVWCVETTDGEFCGWVCFRPAMDYRHAEPAGFRAGDAEVGYRLQRKFWGQGLATEAAQAVIERGLGLPGAARAVASALASNKASCRVLQKCGLEIVGEFPVEGFDSVAYSFVREQSKRERI
ncbi:MAG: GNAT family N-acetyltransferase [Planctomycetaceae bacterium]|nr:GNAT family N-acetyltransferase [Planctomycetaceae bacterium]